MELSKAHSNIDNHPPAHYLSQEAWQELSALLLAVLQEGPIPGHISEQPCMPTVDLHPSLFLVVDSHFIYHLNYITPKSN